MSKVCLITGSSRGIGREAARMVAADGWDIAIAYVERREAAEEVAAQVEATGRRAIAVKADVASETEVIAMFDEAERRLGPVTALVNSAGVSVHARVADLDATRLERMLAINVLGTMLCCREAVRRMSTMRGRKGGVIVNVSSMAATIGGRAAASTYAATKGAIDVFTSGLAKEVAMEGIRANVVRPAMIETEMATGQHDAKQLAAIAATIPMQRLGTPAEVAAAIVFLLSDKAAFITGAHLNVSGGGFHVGAP